jgi:hypothetical protein
MKEVSSLQEKPNLLLYPVEVLVNTAEDTQSIVKDSTTLCSV